jgi:hypothetical protein
MNMVGYDDCIVGVADTFGSPTRIVYDRDAIIEKLMKKDRMTQEEAYEFHEFNQAGAYVGEGTPIFMSMLQPKGETDDRQERALEPLLETEPREQTTSQGKRSPEQGKRKPVGSHVPHRGAHTAKSGGGLR